MRRVLLLCAALMAAALITPPVSAAPSEPAAIGAVSVSGVVTDAVTGEPLVDVCVSTRSDDAEYPWWEQRTCSGADGSYEFAVMPGRYEVQFDPTSSDYGSQWWPMVHSPVDAEVVVVRRGAPLTGIDAELYAGATLTGRAVEGSTGQPMEQVCIEVYAAGKEEPIQTAGGYDVGSRWSISGLPPGEVTLRLSRCLNWYRHTWAYDALTYEDATTFQLAAGETTELGRVELAAGATLTGTVTSRRSDEPLGDIVVTDEAMGRAGEFGAFVGTTAADGTYVIEDVQPGTWFPTAYDAAAWNHRPAWANGWADGARDPRRAKPTVVTPGGVATVDFRLDRPATIKGTLAGTQQWMVADAYLRRYQGDHGRHEILRQSDVDPDTDEFTLRGLPATKVLIRFDSDADGRFYYDGARDVEDAVLLRLRPGKTVRIDAHFPADN